MRRGLFKCITLICCDVPAKHPIAEVGCWQTRIGVYANRRDGVFKDWQRNIREFTNCPNARVKPGGMGMQVIGLDYEKRPVPRSSNDDDCFWH